jgi:hypothetical protein
VLPNKEDSFFKKRKTITTDILVELISRELYIAFIFNILSSSTYIFLKPCISYGVRVIIRGHFNIFNAVPIRLGQHVQPISNLKYETVVCKHAVTNLNILNCLSIRYQMTCNPGPSINKPAYKYTVNPNAKIVRAF